MKEAEAVLIERGFTQLDDQWAGLLTVSKENIEVRVFLPQNFPYQAPEFFVTPKNLSRRIPHVEQNGKLCLISNTGVLIDSDRPRDIITNCLERAVLLLQDGLSGTNEADFIEEFDAYWGPSCDRVRIKSICTAETPSREICIFRFRTPAIDQDNFLACDDPVAGTDWLTRASVEYGQIANGWLYFLNTPFCPPDFDERLRTGDFFKLVKANSTDADYASFTNWLTNQKLPCIVVCCMHAPAGECPIMFAVMCNKASGKNKANALKGFREDSLPTLVEFSHTFCQPITRFIVERLDWRYLLPRAGGSTGLKNKTVAVIGCGAVGSILAEKLAYLGVGTIRLVDKECLCSANLHRHVLGAQYLGQNKATALSNLLSKRFPHITLAPSSKTVQAVLKDDPNDLLHADLICIALGDETTELWLNDNLRNHIPRLHAWVDPLGIGGHVLVTGQKDARSCYRCLFKNDDTVGLHNAASFAKAGQTFTRSFAGCAGRFTPFTYWDADRTASEAAKCAFAVLSGEQQTPSLVSWRGDMKMFIEAGFICSQRALLFLPGEIKHTSEFSDRSCRCNKW